MTSSSQGTFEKFMDFCSISLQGEDPIFLGSIRTRYEGCEEQFRNSEEMIKLLETTQKNMSDESRKFVHLRGLLNELKTYAAVKRKQKHKKLRRLSDSERVEQDAKVPKLKDCSIHLKKFPSEEPEDVSLNAFDRPKRRKTCSVGDGNLDGACIIDIANEDQVDSVRAELGASSDLYKMFYSSPTCGSGSPPSRESASMKNFTTDQDDLYCSHSSIHISDSSGSVKVKSRKSVAIVGVDGLAEECCIRSGSLSLPLNDKTGICVRLLPGNENSSESLPFSDCDKSLLEHRTLKSEPSGATIHITSDNESTLIKSHRTSNNELSVAKSHRTSDHKSSNSKSHATSDTEPSETKPYTSDSEPAMAEVHTADIETPVAKSCISSENEPAVAKVHTSVNESSGTKSHRTSDNELLGTKSHRILDYEPSVGKLHATSNSEPSITKSHRTSDNESPMAKTHATPEIEPSLVKAHRISENESPVTNAQRTSDNEPSVAKAQNISTKSPQEKSIFIADDELFDSSDVLIIQSSPSVKQHHRDILNSESGEDSEIVFNALKFSALNSAHKSNRPYVNRSSKIPEECPDLGSESIPSNQSVESNNVCPLTPTKRRNEESSFASFTNCSMSDTESPKHSFHEHEETYTQQPLPVDDLVLSVLDDNNEKALQPQDSSEQHSSTEICERKFHYSDWEELTDSHNEDALKPEVRSDVCITNEGSESGLLPSITVAGPAGCSSTSHMIPSTSGSHCKAAHKPESFSTETTSILDKETLEAGASADEFQDMKSLDTEAMKRRRIFRLERLLRKLHDEIVKCQNTELTLDEMNNEDAAYIYEDRLKQKFVKVWNKLCEVAGRSITTGRPTEKTIKYSGTRYKEINRRIQKFLNRKKEFPDFHDIKKIVKLTNKKCGLNMSSMMINDISREAFVDVGEMLQTRRHQDFIATFGTRQTDLLGNSSDPYLSDPELRRKLDSNRHVARSNLDSVIAKYTKLQYGKNDDSADDSEEDVKKKDNADERDKKIRKDVTEETQELQTLAAAEDNLVTAESIEVDLAEECDDYGDVHNPFTPEPLGGSHTPPKSAWYQNSTTPRRVRPLLKDFSRDNSSRGAKDFPGLVISVPVIENLSNVIVIDESPDKSMKENLFSANSISRSSIVREVPDGKKISTMNSQYAENSLDQTASKRKGPNIKYTARKPMSFFNEFGKKSKPICISEVPSDSRQECMPEEQFSEHILDDDGAMDDEDDEVIFIPKISDSQADPALISNLSPVSVHHSPSPTRNLELLSDDSVEIDDRQRHENIDNINQASPPLRVTENLLKHGHRSRKNTSSSDIISMSSPESEDGHSMVSPESEDGHSMTSTSSILPKEVVCLTEKVGNQLLNHKDEPGQNTQCDQTDTKSTRQSTSLDQEQITLTDSKENLTSSCDIVPPETMQHSLNTILNVVNFKKEELNKAVFDEQKLNLVQTPADLQKVEADNVQMEKSSAANDTFNKATDGECAMEVEDCPENESDLQSETNKSICDGQKLGIVENVACENSLSSSETEIQSAQNKAKINYEMSGSVGSHNLLKCSKADVVVDEITSLLETEETDNAIAEKLETSRSKTSHVKSSQASVKSHVETASRESLEMSTKSLTESSQFAQKEFFAAGEQSSEKISRVAGCEIIDEGEICTNSTDIFTAEIEPSFDTNVVKERSEHRRLALTNEKGAFHLQNKLTKTAYSHTENIQPVSVVGETSSKLTQELDMDQVILLEDALSQDSHSQACLVPSSKSTQDIDMDQVIVLEDALSEDSHPQACSVSSSKSTQDLDMDQVIVLEDALSEDSHLQACSASSSKSTQDLDMDRVILSEDALSQDSNPQACLVPELLEPSKHEMCVEEPDNHSAQQEDPDGRESYSPPVLVIENNHTSSDRKSHKDSVLEEEEDELNFHDGEQITLFPPQPDEKINTCLKENFNSFSAPSKLRKTQDLETSSEFKVMASNMPEGKASSQSFNNSYQIIFENVAKTVCQTGRLQAKGASNNIKQKVDQEMEGDSRGDRNEQNTCSADFTVIDSPKTALNQNTKEQLQDSLHHRHVKVPHVDTAKQDYEMKHKHSEIGEKLTVLGEHADVSKQYSPTAIPSLTKAKQSAEKDVNVQDQSYTQQFYQFISLHSPAAPSCSRPETANDSMDDILICCTTGIFNCQHECCQNAADERIVVSETHTVNEFSFSNEEQEDYMENCESRSNYNETDNTSNTGHNQGKAFSKADTIQNLDRNDENDGLCKLVCTEVSANNPTTEEALGTSNYEEIKDYMEESCGKITDDHEINNANHDESRNVRTKSGKNLLENFNETNSCISESQVSENLILKSGNSLDTTCSKARIEDKENIGCSETELNHSEHALREEHSITGEGDPNLQNNSNSGILCINVRSLADSDAAKQENCLIISGYHSSTNKAMEENGASVSKNGSCDVEDSIMVVDDCLMEVGDDSPTDVVEEIEEGDVTHETDSDSEETLKNNGDNDISVLNKTKNAEEKELGEEDEIKIIEELSSMREVRSIDRSKEDHRKLVDQLISDIAINKTNKMMKSPLVGSKTASTSSPSSPLETHETKSSNNVENNDERPSFVEGEPSETGDSCSLTGSNSVGHSSVLSLDCDEVNTSGEKMSQHPESPPQNVSPGETRESGTQLRKRRSSDVDAVSQPKKQKHSTKPDFMSDIISCISELTPSKRANQATKADGHAGNTESNKGAATHSKSLGQGDDDDDVIVLEDPLADSSGGSRSNRSIPRSQKRPSSSSFTSLRGSTGASSSHQQFKKFTGLQRNFTPNKSGSNSSFSENQLQVLTNRKSSENHPASQRGKAPLVSSSSSSSSGSKAIRTVPHERAGSSHSLPRLMPRVPIPSIHPNQANNLTKASPNHYSSIMRFHTSPHRRLQFSSSDMMPSPRDSPIRTHPAYTSAIRQSIQNSGRLCLQAKPAAQHSHQKHRSITSTLSSNHQPHRGVSGQRDKTINRTNDRGKQQRALDGLEIVLGDSDEEEFCNITATGLKILSVSSLSASPSSGTNTLTKTQSGKKSKDVIVIPD